MNRRLQKEIEMLTRDPGPGISVWPSGETTNELHAQVVGPEDSPYAGGLFSLVLNIPDKYPFEPPRVRFTTPVYHPNIDGDGRICLDTLKMQPQGSWSPSVNINTLLITIRVLLAHPNADDGLVPEITELYRRDIASFKRNALAHTREHAVAAPVEQITHCTASATGIAASSAPVPIDDSSDSSSSESSDDDDDDDDDSDDSGNEQVSDSDNANSSDVSIIKRTLDSGEYTEESSGKRPRK